MSSEGENNPHGFALLRFAPCFLLKRYLQEAASFLRSQLALMEASAGTASTLQRAFCSSLWNTCFSKGLGCVNPSPLEIVRSLEGSAWPPVQAPVRGQAAGPTIQTAGCGSTRPRPGPKRKKEAVTARHRPALLVRNPSMRTFLGRQVMRWHRIQGQKQGAVI